MHTPSVSTHEPACHCPQPTAWEDRTPIGAWPDLPEIESRTCPDCHATLSREVES